MHKFSTQASADLTTIVKKKKSGPPNPAEEAEQGAYRLDPGDGKKGQLCLPGEHFFQSMVAAASGFQVQGQGKKTYKDPVKGNVFIEPEYIGLTDRVGRAIYDYNIDSRPARIKNARINRNRPLIQEWMAEFDLITDEEIVPGAVINSILISAGQTKGVGDYRPRFGRFMVIQFKEV
jgi:hypothetical protein